MPVIAVINRKGGSGKSTLATHLSAWLARQGEAVMLGDVDRQQCARAWLKRRDANLPAIAAWAIDQRNILKVPAGVTHVVLDTPGGMQGFELAKVVMSTDAIIMPVCSSLFDRESASACLAELLALPRIASGRCRLGVVGMRIDARTHAAQVLRDWAHEQHVPFLGVLRETQTYVRSLENGQTVFDLRATSSAADLLQWEPILEWLFPVANATPAPTATMAPAKPIPANSPPLQQDSTAERLNTPRAVSLMPAQESMVHGNRLSVFATSNPVSSQQGAELPAMPRNASRERTGVPQFLLRH